MDSKVNKSLQGALEAYAQVENIAVADLYRTLEQVFNADLPFVEKVNQLDQAFDDEPRFEELREYVFDLLMINFFSEDVQKLEEDYLESEEWEQIEEDTLERGSELLNLLLYLQECEDTEIEPSLDDFLKEFLLVEEDEFQDEHRIYEQVIANQMLLESPFSEIAKVAKSIDIEEEIKPIFYPLMSFFSETNPSEDTLTDFVSQSDNKSLDLAIYQLILHFK